MVRRKAVLERYAALRCLRMHCGDRRTEEKRIDRRESGDDDVAAWGRSTRTSKYNGPISCNRRVQEAPLNSLPSAYARSPERNVTTLP
eukprot:1520696-Prymnesium_polylepis.1